MARPSATVSADRTRVRPPSIGGQTVVGKAIRLENLTLKNAARLLAAIALVLFLLGALALAASPGDSVAGEAPLAKCHTVTPQTYNRAVRKLDRLERLNPELPNRKHKRATRKVCKHSTYRRVKSKIKAICRPVHVVTGRTSVFNDSQTYTGISAATHEGLAINPVPGTAAWGSARVRSWATRGAKFLVRLKGRQRVTRLIDIGPHQSTHRAIDFSYPLASAMGFPTGWSFPTDSIGSVYRYRYGCK